MSRDLIRRVREYLRQRGRRSRATGDEVQMQEEEELYPMPDAEVEQENAEIDWHLRNERGEKSH